MFLSYSSPSHSPYQVFCQPPCSSNFVFFSLKKEKQTPSQLPLHTAPNKWTPQIWSPFWVGQLLLIIRSPLKCSWCTQCHSIQENWFFSLPAAVNCYEFFSQGWDFKLWTPNKHISTPTDQRIIQPSSEKLLPVIDGN